MRSLSRKVYATPNSLAHNSLIKQNKKSGKRKYPGCVQITIKQKKKKKKIGITKFWPQNCRRSYFKLVGKREDTASLGAVTAPVP